MKNSGQFFLAAIILPLFMTTATVVTYAAEAEKPTVPWTQEKVKPQEIQDKEKKKDDPIATCEKTDKKTGEKYHDVVYRDGTDVRYYPVSKKWVITIPGPKGKTKITYDAQNKTRTVEEPGKPPAVQDPKKDPAAKDWKEGKEKEEQDAKKSAPCGGSCNPPPAPSSTPDKQGLLRLPFFPDWLVRVSDRASGRKIFPQRDLPNRSSSIILAATVERSPAPAPQTQERPTVVVINVKLVTHGDPPPGTTIHFDPGPQTTPEDFTQNPHPSWWDWLIDPERPWISPGPTGQPQRPGQPEQPGQPQQPGQPGQPGQPSIPIPTPGGGIHVGWGWAFGWTPYGFPQTCTTDDEPGTTPQTQTRDDDFKGFFGAERRTAQTRVRDCSEIAAKFKALLDMLKSLHDLNSKHAKAASDAFWGDPNSRYYGGYKHWLSQAQVTEAVVDANNAVGKALIDTALFAMGGWGGFGGKFGKVADTLFGPGIRGAESAAGAYYKIAQKVIGKVGDEYIGGKAGTLGTSAWKTADKIGWDGTSVEPHKLLQGSLSGLESILRGSIIDALGNWMKEGAMSADLERAKTAYKEFVTNAMMANVEAAAVAQIKEDYDKLVEEAKLQNCPVPEFPNYDFYTFDIEPFGMGNFRGQKGPTMRVQPAQGAPREWDMFGRNSSPI